MYKVITPIQLTNGLWALRESKISFKAFRVYMSCFELVAIREAAERSRSRQTRRGQGITPFFRKDEILRLIRGQEGEAITRELRALERTGLLCFRSERITITQTPLPGSAELLEELSGRRSPARPVPVPRRAVRFIAACRRPAVVKTMLAYMLRGLSIDRSTGDVRGRGAVKAAWIAGAFGLSLRAVRAARAELMSLGWISKDTGSKQWKLNKTGAYFEINLGWKHGATLAPKRSHFGSRGEAQNLRPEKRRGNQEPRSAQAMDSAPQPAAESAPREPQKCAQFAPPYKDMKTSYEYKNQKTPPAAEETGFCKEKRGQGREAEPDIRNIKLIDLKKPTRLEALYREFVRVGELQASEASAINFAATAVRAGRLDIPDDRRVRVFLGIVKRRLWVNITQAEEDRALSVIRHCREQDPGFMKAA